jgi:hypothetical protein
MPIPEAQLKEWSLQGPAGTSAETFSAVRRALGGIDTKKYGRPEILMSGSFANETNTARTTDLDIVVLFKDVFYPDVSGLNAHDLSIYQRERTTGRFSIVDARSHVLGLVGKVFGDSEVKLGTKVIELAATEERMPVKLVAACGHKYFYTFPSKPASRFVEGIVFADYAGKETVNYPQQHLENGAAKAKAVTSFRPVVRLFKNFAAQLEQDGQLRPGSAPSYFLESFIYNVPNTSFYSSLESTVQSLLIHWGMSRSKWDEQLQQHKVTKLFGPAETQWDISKAEEFVNACRTAWDGWSEQQPAELGG